MMGSEEDHKYCVITNWWKERLSNGQYKLPSVDATLYGGVNIIRSATRNDDHVPPESNSEEDGINYDNVI